MKQRQLTLALILQEDQVLLLNRYKKPYIGQWNGFGGKIEAGETPEIGIQRELKEETGLLPSDYELIQNGQMSWYVSGVYQNEIYLFTAKVTSRYTLEVPKSTREGLLNLFPRDWAMQPENYGVIADLKAVYPYMIRGEQHHFKTNFEADQLVEFKIEANK